MDCCIRLILCIALLALVACDGATPAAGAADPAARGRLVLTGSSTVAPLASEIARRFEAAHPGARIDVQTGGSSRGIADARRGLADIGMASRALAAEESDLVAHPIAVDGVGMILHRDNPVAVLTTAQIADIYTGAIANWSDLGGADAPITVVNKADGRATLEVFLAHVGLEPADIRPDVVIGDNQQGIRTVAGDPHAIGYVSIGAAGFEASRGVPIRLLSMEGVPATAEHVTDGSYPMARPLILVTPATLSPLARAFIDFACSDAVHDLIEAQSFVPIRD